ncbi:MAG: phenylalanine--tRNA ligase subunit beta [Lewinellaceae bacterium]|nr:phenylalanine--tRNA ligase subunit beta [Lewinellaceae bacterium]
MKVSLNWLRDFLDLDKSTAEIADILTSLGLEVEGWEDVKPSPVDLDKVVTGHVLECERIPETDHLSATKVDVGDGVIRSIVCGAPNVASGQKVFVALPGANVFSKDGQLFAIGERKVKGVPSQGMICAQDELGIGHDHSGIMILPATTALGITAAHYLQMDADTVVEIGLTPNRADATNHQGVARDLAAYLRVHESRDIRIRYPESTEMPTAGQVFEVVVSNEEACPRYTGVVIRGIRVGESPDWIKNRLLAVGQRPINNVVDVTNYVRMELGQPLHAFDLAKIKGGKIQVKTLPAGTAFKSLDETERKLFAEDLMICDGESNPMCIGGVFGGFDSGVTDKTTDIFLESAFFNAGWIRRTMLRHNLRTDSAWSFEKGVDPNGCLIALRRAAQLILQLAGGNIASPVVDMYSKPVMPARIPVEYTRINALIGENLPKEKVKNILAALEIGVENETDSGFSAIVPTNKPDVIREADIVEEVLRVYGLDKVPIPAQIRSSIEIQQRPNPDAMRNLAADFLAASGFNECMGMSLSNSAYYLGPDAPFPLEKEQLVFIHNSANQGLDCLRPSLLFSGLETVQRNQNRQNPDLRLFEFGKSYGRRTADGAQGYPPSEGGRGEESLHNAFIETMRLTVLVTGAHSAESWQPSAKKMADYYTLKPIVQNLLARLGMAGYQESIIQEPPFRYALKYHRGTQELVTFGAVLPALLKKMDIKNPVFFADFHFENVLKALAGNKIQFAELNKYPVVRRDLALLLDKGVAFGEIRQLANKTAKKLLKDVNLFDVFEDEQKLGAGKKSCAVSFTFEDPEKTLQDKEIDHLMQQLQQVFETKLNAIIRKG